MDLADVELADGFIDAAAKMRKDVKVDRNGGTNQSKGCGRMKKAIEDAILGLNKVSKEYVILYITMFSLPITFSSFYSQAATNDSIFVMNRMNTPRF